jgi:hypothetical protein
MNARFLTLAFFLFGSGKQVAFVDLSLPARTPEIGPQSGHVRGGRVYDGGITGPQPGTPPVSLKLNRVISMKEDGFIKDVVEVVMTNIGNIPLTVPIGDDPVPLLQPTEKDRRYFEFVVTLHEGKAVRGIGAVRSATNSNHPESSALLQPGDTVVFWLPAGTWQPTAPPTSESDANQEVSVSVSSNRKVIDKGRDVTDVLGEDVHSENTLPMPHVAKVEMMH